MLYCEKKYLYTHMCNIDPSLRILGDKEQW